MVGLLETIPSVTLKSGSGTIELKETASITTLRQLLECISHEPFSSNGHMRAAQAMYCASLCQQLNPEDRLLSIISGASGPDLLVPLLCTNAQKIHCIDLMPVNYECFAKLLDGKAAKLYRVTEQDRRTDAYTSKFDPTVPAEGASATQLFLDLGIEQRTNHGFWKAGFIETFGLERLILIELDKMGVPLSDITARQNGEAVTIKFPWPYPGRSAQMREVTYQRGDVESVLSSMPGKYDGYIEKSRPDISLLVDKFYGGNSAEDAHFGADGRSAHDVFIGRDALFSRILISGGFVVMGEFMCKKEGFFAHPVTLKSTLEDLGRFAQQFDHSVVLPDSACAQLANQQFGANSPLGSYGWLLFGYRRAMTVQS